LTHRYSIWLFQLVVVSESDILVMWYLKSGFYVCLTLLRIFKDLFNRIHELIDSAQLVSCSGYFFLSMLLSSLCALCLLIFFLRGGLHLLRFFKIWQFLACFHENWDLFCFVFLLIKDINELIRLGFAFVKVIKQGHCGTSFNPVCLPKLRQFYVCALLFEFLFNLFALSPALSPFCLHSVQVF